MIPTLNYIDNLLYIENVPVTQIAKEFSTPCLIYSKQKIKTNVQEYSKALQNTTRPYKIYYAVKANSNLHILRLLADLGAHFDVVSGGEIQRVLRAGAKPSQIVFSGVGKSSEELRYAISLPIYAIHIESIPELLRVHDLAKQLDQTISIALRINPNISANTHKYISTGSKENKFGIDINHALETYLLANSLSNLDIKGIACHIGSQITSTDPFAQAIDQLLAIKNQLQEHDIHLEYIDVGGGLGIQYKDENPPSHAEYIEAINNKLNGHNLCLHIEPGRSIIGNAGFLLTRVEYLKKTDYNNFAIVDSGMNDLLRPALYQSYHEIIPVQKRDTDMETYSIVGPICESGDFLGHERHLSIQADDLLLIRDCGAYVASMSSNYNTRPRPPEVLVHGSKIQLIRTRETIDELLAQES